MVDYQQIQDGRREYIYNFHDFPEILLAFVFKLSLVFQDINKSTSKLSNRPMLPKW